MKGHRLIALSLLGNMFLLMLLMRRRSLPSPVQPSGGGCVSLNGKVSDVTACFRDGKGCKALYPNVKPLVIHEMSQADRVPLLRGSEDVPITFVTAPRAFDADTTARQRAAILSWQLQPSQAKEIILMGDEPGIEEFASEWGFRSVKHIEKDERGIPLMDSLFKEASKAARWRTHSPFSFLSFPFFLPA